MLNAFPEELSAKAATQLQRLGVDVRTSTMVTGIDEHGVTLGQERSPGTDGALGGRRRGVASRALARRAARQARAA